MFIKPIPDFQRGHVQQSLRVISPERLRDWLEKLIFSNWERGFALQLCELTPEGGVEQVPGALLHSQEVSTAAKERAACAEELQARCVNLRRPLLLTASTINREHRVLVLPAAQ